jgi:DNA-binding transcriptional LysR family regulator
VAQPSLTTAIGKLERELGGALFDRRRGAPTELGLLVKPFLQQIAWNAASATARAHAFTNAAPAAGVAVNGRADAAWSHESAGSGEASRPVVAQKPIEWVPVERDLRKGFAAVE